MKKNLRIVSAAAAALLAVAPVAAASVATVNATDYTVATNSGINFDMRTKHYASRVRSSKVQSDAEAVLTGNHYAPATLHASHTAAGSISNVTLTKATGASALTFRGITGSSISGTVPARLNGGTYHANVDVRYNLPATGYTPAAAGGDNIVINGHSYQVQGSTGAYYIEVSFSRPVVVASQNAPESAYFSTADGNQLANDAVVTASVKNSARVHSIDSLKQAIKNTIRFNHAGNSEAAAWNEYIFGDSNATSDQNLISQLENQGITVSSGQTFKPGNKSYTIVVRANGGLKVNVVFQNTDANNAVAPAFRVRSDASASGKTDWTAAFNVQPNVPAINLKLNDSSNGFNIRDYIEALPNPTTNATISYTVSNNNVDVTKAGLYHVTVAATHGTHTTTLTIPVIVSDANGRTMTVAHDGNFYRLDSNNNMVQVDPNTDQLLAGEHIVVFGQPVAHNLNGQSVQFYRVVSSSSNLWVRASDLLNGESSSTSNAQAVSKTINHIAAVYDKDGNQTNDQKLRAYDSVQVLPTTVTIKGSKMYQLVENGKAVDKYVKASNIDGTSKTLKHNSYVYTQYGHKVYKKNGKAVKMPKRGKRGSLRKVASGSTVTVYGGALFNKQYYRIGHNQYIKVANFR